MIRRGGITLLEVLISMFVLAVGQLGIAAMIPAGRHEVARGSRLDQAAAVGRAAFRDLQIRRFLYPGDSANTVRWVTTGSIEIFDPDGSELPPGTARQPFRDIVNGTPNGPPKGPIGAQVAVAIDPLGLLAGYSTQFPHNELGDQPHLTRIYPIVAGAPTSLAFWDSIFRANVDLTTQPNTTNVDLPPGQFWIQDSGGANARRASAGDYSWLATVVSDPTQPALTGKVIVSVVVFHKRDLSGATATERSATASLSGVLGGIGGGEVILGSLTKAVQPGQWIMLAGRHQEFREPFTDAPVANGTYDPGEPYVDLNHNGVYDATPVFLDYFRWFRVASARPLNGTQQEVTLAGADWSKGYFDNPPGSVTRAIILDNVVAVYEKNVALEQ